MNPIDELFVEIFVLQRASATIDSLAWCCLQLNLELLFLCCRMLDACTRNLPVLCSLWFILFLRVPNNYQSKAHAVIISLHRGIFRFGTAWHGCESFYLLYSEVCATKLGRSPYMRANNRGGGGDTGWQHSRAVLNHNHHTHSQRIPTGLWSDKRIKNSSVEFDKPVIHSNTCKAILVIAIAKREYFIKVTFN